MPLRYVTRQLRADYLLLGSVELEPLSIVESELFFFFFVVELPIPVVSVLL